MLARILRSANENAENKIFVVETASWTLQTRLPERERQQAMTK